MISITTPEIRNLFCCGSSEFFFHGGYQIKEKGGLKVQLELSETKKIAILETVDFS